MTSHDADSPRPIDTGPIDALNRYIDGLADGIDQPSADLDPRLIAAVRAIHSRNLAASDIAPGRADEDRLWWDLMQLRPRPELRALPRSRAATTLPPLTDDTMPLPVMARRGLPQPTGRLRHIGGRTLGLVATLTLVALVTLSGLAVWFSAPPDRDSSDPGLFGGIDASPTYPAMVAVGATPEAVDAIGPVPTDTVRPIYQECTATPRTLENVFAVVTGPLDLPGPYSSTGDGVPASLIFLPQLPGQDYPERNPAGLPDGTAVEPAVIEELADVYGESMGCGIGSYTTTLRSAALMSDNGLLRMLWSESDIPFLDNDALVRLGAQLEAPPNAWEVVGQPGLIYLYGFRTLDDGRVAAWLEQAPVPGGSGGGSYWKLRLDNGPANNYVVFVRTPQGWLIDELDSGGRG